MSLRLWDSALVSPLGPAAVAAAALRGGLSRARELPWAPVLGIGDAAAPAVGHPAVEAPSSDAERIAALLAQLPAPLPAEALIAVLPLASPTRQVADPLPLIAAWAGGQPDAVLPLGHAGLAAALIAVAERRQRAVVLAIDTLLGDEALAWLHADERIRGPDTAFGLAPGEAAAWWLVGPGTGGTAIRAGWIAGDGRRAPADDAERWWTAARQAGIAAGRRWDLVDLTGEAWRDRAWGGTAPQRGDAEALPVATGWGDLGAAAAAATGCAALAWRGPRPAGTTLWNLSEDGSAGVIALDPG